MKQIVDISDGKVSARADDELLTHSLGSCIGVTLYDPEAHVGGLLHFQLPQANRPMNQVKRPYMYADTGMALMLHELLCLGAEKKRLSVKIAGGARIMDDTRMYAMGRRNYDALCQFLTEHGLRVEKQDVGGFEPRNMSLAIADGTVCVKCAGAEKTL